MSKKIWDKPELTVLARGRPEEAVLEVCKIWEWGGGITGPNELHNQCVSKAPDGTCIDEFCNATAET